MAKRSPKELVKIAEKQAWRVEPIKKGWKLYPPDQTKPFVTLHRTPSDRHWYANAVARLRGSGLII